MNWILFQGSLDATYNVKKKVCHPLIKSPQTIIQEFSSDAEPHLSFRISARILG